MRTMTGGAHLVWKACSNLKCENRLCVEKNGHAGALFCSYPLYLAEIFFPLFVRNDLNFLRKAVMGVFFAFKKQIFLNREINLNRF